MSQVPIYETQTIVIQSSGTWMQTTDTYVFFSPVKFQGAFKSRNVEEYQNVFSKCFSKVSKDEGIFYLLVMCRKMTNTAHSGHIFASTRLAACSYNTCKRWVGEHE